jgi:hypothetical protein
MKNLKTIKQDVYNYLHSFGEMTTKEKREYENLKLCEKYLETKPTEEFVKSEIERISGKINFILDSNNFKQWFNCHPEYRNDKNPQTIYRSEMGLGKFRRQLKTLNYIFNDTVQSATPSTK